MLFGKSDGICVVDALLSSEELMSCASPGLSGGLGSLGLALCAGIWPAGCCFVLKQARGVCDTLPPVGLGTRERGPGMAVGVGRRDQRRDLSGSRFIAACTQAAGSGCDDAQKALYNMQKQPCGAYHH